MPLEIERKFLVKDDSWRSSASEPVRICQKYITLNPGLKGVIRLRIAGDSAFLTLKTPQSGFTRGEYEYEIPVSEAEELMRGFCPGGAVEKLRYRIDFQGHLWEIDEFFGGCAGLVLAEIELSFPDEQFPLPPWVGEEVTGDFRYSNSSLAERSK